MHFSQYFLQATRNNTSRGRVASTGFDSIEAYYASSSSDEAVPNVRVPLLCIQVRAVAPHLFALPNAVRDPQGTTAQMPSHPRKRDGMQG